MNIWVDADACPVAIRDILLRAAQRTETRVTLVANQPIPVPNSPWVRMRQVAQGFDVADNDIVQQLAPGDLVITADIPLAAEVIAAGGHAINPRGERYTEQNIHARLNMRDFMDILRSSGVHAGGPPPLTPADRKRFADQLDRFLAGARSADG